MPAPLDIAGAALYLVALLTCLWTARPRGGQGGWRLWVAAALALLGLSRLFDLEGRTRTLLRSAWLEDHAYEDRGMVQAGLAVLFLLAALAFGWGMANMGRRGPPWPITVAIGGLVGLAVLRTLSWHTTDRVLYAGPAFPKFHHLAEVALIFAVVASLLVARGRDLP